MKEEITFKYLLKVYIIIVTIRIGIIIKIDEFPIAKIPSYQLTIDFGELGIKKSIAQITDLYSKEDLLKKQISAVINFKPRQIANFKSEVLVLGVYNNEGNVVLLKAGEQIKNGEQVS